jgi:MerR family mercuric resistance operon transcriptional regulator
MSVSALTISKLAKAADVNIETIRYYQRVGLIEQPQKPAHGYRQYPEATLTRVRFIKRAQRLGFALKEVEELLKLDDEQCTEAKKLAEQKLSIIEENIADLSAMRLTLNNLINACNQSEKNNDNLNSCRIIQALTDENILKKMAATPLYAKSKVSNA